MKQKYLAAYMDMVTRFAETSEAKRLKVGAALLKNDKIISLGINGTPPGWFTNECEDDYRETAWYTRHAEVACLDNLLHSNETSTNSTMIITHSPCKICAIRMKIAGITKVYYRNTYRDDSGVKYLQNNGVEIERI